MHLLIVVLIVIVLFGSKRLPDLGRSFGEAIREFKKSLKEGAEAEDKEDKPQS
jgi:sec-independent protein translocase protein TatA